MLSLLIVTKLSDVSQLRERQGEGKGIPCGIRAFTWEGKRSVANRKGKRLDTNGFMFLFKEGWGTAGQQIAEEGLMFFSFFCKRFPGTGGPGLDLCSCFEISNGQKRLFNLLVAQF